MKATISLATKPIFVSEAAVAKHIGSIFATLDLTPDDGHRRVKVVLRYLNG